MTFRDSRTRSLLITGRERLAYALSNAVTTRQMVSVIAWLRTVFAGSRIAHVIQWGGQVGRTSWLYRWLTSEPEPEVVVIDLRETKVVGPMIRVLDRFLALVTRNGDRAHVGNLLLSLYKTARTRPIQVASLVVLAGLAANLLLLAARGSLTANAAGIRLVVAALALAGTRVTVSWERVRDSRVAALVVALLEPPEPPERGDSPPAAKRRDPRDDSPDDR